MSYNTSQTCDETTTCLLLLPQQRTNPNVYNTYSIQHLPSYSARRTGSVYTACTWRLKNPAPTPGSRHSCSGLLPLNQSSILHLYPKDITWPIAYYMLNIYFVFDSIDSCLSLDIKMLSFLVGLCINKPVVQQRFVCL